MHDWLCNNPDVNDIRTCLACGTTEQYILVDFGRSKEWIPETDGQRIARENREVCNSLTKEQRTELLDKALQEIINWHDRDGSVGGCSEVIENARLARTTQEIERLALASHRATEALRALSMQNTATEPDEREKQAVTYALATGEMLEARRALDAALSPNSPASATGENKEGGKQHE